MTTTPHTNATFDQIADVIREHDDFVLCGHVSPDGDCLGSQLTLHHALKALGKRSTCVLVRDEPVEDALSFMPGMEDMIPAEKFEGTCEVFMGLDVPTRERIGAAVKILDASTTSITIDHHEAEERMCDYVYVDPDCASASMLVWEVVKLLLPQPPQESALCAYVGLATDTGGFRFQNSDARAFEAAADLIQHGCDPAYAAVNAFQSRSIPSLKLEALVIDRLQLFADGQVAISWALQEDFDRLGATKADAEPLIDCVRSVGGTRIACMLREQDGHVRGSLRSKDDTDVAQLARELHGGGHKAAAGFTLDMPMEEALTLLERRMCELVANA